MSYNSTFIITTTPPTIIHLDFYDEEDTTDEDGEFDGFSEGLEMSWYSYKKDLLKESLKHPDCLIGVTRYGEDPLDIEYTYIRNGEMYSSIPKITMPPFCAGLLKDPPDDKSVFE